jgi:uncharacterized membrane protein
MPAEIVIFLLSICPLIELKGGLIAAALLGVNWKVSLLVCFLGNIFPVIFILLFIKKILAFFKNTKLMKFVEKIEDKADKKSKEVLKYKRVGLMLFVAVPLPGTGTWTGSLIASFLNMKIKDAFISITIGSFISAILMAVASYGLLGIFM